MMHVIGERVDYAQCLYWSSDWNGYEVGFPDISIVGLYTDRTGIECYYLNTENGLILDAWKEDETE